MSTAKSITLINNRFLVLHTSDYLPKTIFAMHSQRNMLLVICMAGANNRHRESILTIHFHKKFLTGNIVS